MTPFGGNWDTAMVCTTCCGIPLTTPPGDSPACTLTTGWPGPGIPATFPTCGFRSGPPDTRQSHRNTPETKTQALHSQARPRQPRLAISMAKQNASSSAQLGEGEGLGVMLPLRAMCIKWALFINHARSHSRDAPRPALWTPTRT